MVVFLPNLPKAQAARAAAAAPVQAHTVNASGVFASEPDCKEAGLVDAAACTQAVAQFTQPGRVMSQQGVGLCLGQGFAPPPQAARPAPGTSGPPPPGRLPFSSVATPSSAPPQAWPMQPPHTHGLIAAGRMQAPAPVVGLSQNACQTGGSVAAGEPAATVGAALCSHGVPLMACGHAAEHLRDVKSFLLDVCEEMLDGQPGVAAWHALC